jgi:hypothetical protein
MANTAADENKLEGQVDVEHWTCNDAELHLVNPSAGRPISELFIISLIGSPASLLWRGFTTRINFRPF